jgi:hypothetical protein
VVADKPRASHSPRYRLTQRILRYFQTGYFPDLVAGCARHRFLQNFGKAGFGPICSRGCRNRNCLPCAQRGWLDALNQAAVLLHALSCSP